MQGSMDRVLRSFFKNPIVSKLKETDTWADIDWGIN